MCAHDLAFRPASYQIPIVGSETEVVGGAEMEGSLRLLVSGEVMLDGIAGGRTARGHGQLAVDGTDMRVDGAGTEHQLVGDLLVGQAACEQAQHLHLPCRQPGTLLCAEFPLCHCSMKW